VILLLNGSRAAMSISTWKSEGSVTGVVAGRQGTAVDLGVNFLTPFRLVRSALHGGRRLAAPT
jgi:hypothetical protein